METASSSQQQQQPMPPTPTPPQQPPQLPTPPQPQSTGGGPPGRGGRGRGGRGGGRTSAGGRTILNVGRGGGRGGGRGRGPQQQPGQKVAPNTGIPFGHVPAYLPGSSSLVEELDQRVMIVLRDGRHLVGNLRTFDQYSNMVLDGASERRFHKSEDDDPTKTITYYTDVPLGMYIVRGDSIVLLGQIGPEDETLPSIVTMKKLDQDAFEELVAKDDDGEPEDGDDAPENEASKQLEWDFDKDLLA